MADFVDNNAEEVDKPDMEDDKVEVVNIDEDKHLLTDKPPEPPEFCRSLLELSSFFRVRIEADDGPLLCLLQDSAWLSEFCRLKPRLWLDWSNLFSRRPVDSEEERRLLEVDIRDELSRDEVSILHQLSVFTNLGKTSEIIIKGKISKLLTLTISSL